MRYETDTQRCSRCCELEAGNNTNVSVDEKPSQVVVVVEFAVGSVISFGFALEIKFAFSERAKFFI